jgi:hypothetical protein
MIPKDGQYGRFFRLQLVSAAPIPNTLASCSAVVCNKKIGLVVV